MFIRGFLKDEEPLHHQKMAHIQWKLGVGETTDWTSFSCTKLFRSNDWTVFKKKVKSQMRNGQVPTSWLEKSKPSSCKMIIIDIFFNVDSACILPHDFFKFCATMKCQTLQIWHLALAKRQTWWQEPLKFSRHPHVPPCPCVNCKWRLYKAASSHLMLERSKPWSSWSRCSLRSILAILWTRKFWK